jgi:hypothetical protein
VWRVRTAVRVTVSVLAGAEVAALGHVEVGVVPAVQVARVTDAPVAEAPVAALVAVAVGVVGVDAAAEVDAVAVVGAVALVPPRVLVRAVPVEMPTSAHR